jgi:hypothetical protein
MKYCKLNLYKINLTLSKACKKKTFIGENKTCSSLKEKTYKLNGILIKNREEVISYSKNDTYEIINF